MNENQTIGPRETGMVSCGPDGGKGGSRLVLPPVKTDDFEDVKSRRPSTRRSRD